MYFGFFLHFVEFYAGVSVVLRRRRVERFSWLPSPVDTSFRDGNLDNLNRRPSTREDTSTVGTARLPCATSVVLGSRLPRVTFFSRGQQPPFRQNFFPSLSPRKKVPSPEETPDFSHRFNN